ncbi:MAG: DUF1552 domain-containing protein [Sandaracinus sp.]
MSFSRRRFLVGIGGAMVALPLLESLDGIRRPTRRRAGVAHADDGVPHPVVFVRAGNGVQQAWSDEPEHFWPAATGALTSAILGGAENADRSTSELAAFASKLAIVRGVDRPFGTPACGHAESICQVLTAAQNTGGTANDPLALGMSADWRIANQLNPAGREPMVLMAGPSSAYIAEGLSWRDSGMRTSAERSPINQYMRMMGISGAPPEIQERIRMRRASVNDLVRAELRELMGHAQLSAGDRARLQQHLEAIRDTELQLMSCAADPAMEDALAAIDDPTANDVRPEVVQRFMDVIALAFACGYTRAATLQIGEGNDQTQYTIDGVQLPRFHWISHRIYSDGADGEPIPQAVELHAKVDRLQMQLYRYLLERLDAIRSPVAGHTLLDESIAVWTNDLSAGPPHGGENIPWLLAGGAGGALRVGQFLDAGGVTHNKLLNTILTAAGCTKDDGSPVDDFGDASLEGGNIPALVAG